VVSASGSGGTLWGEEARIALMSPHCQIVPLKAAIQFPDMSHFTFRTTSGA
jgi:hypothetical protein